MGWVLIVGGALGGLAWWDGAHGGAGVPGWVLPLVALVGLALAAVLAGIDGGL